MRILFLSTIFPNPYQPTLGIFNLQLLRALGAKHEVRVVAPIPWTEEWSRARREGKTMPSGRVREVEGIRIYHPRYWYTPRILRSYYGTYYWLSVRRTLRRLLAEFSPDVILAYWAHPDGEVALRAGRWARVPSAVIVGGSDVLVITENKSRWQRVAHVLRSVDAVLTVSQQLRAKVLEFGAAPEKVHVLYQGVDVERFCPGDQIDARRRLGLPVEGRMLVWVGRMVPVKGLDVLLKACALLRSRGEDFHLYLVGDGPLRRELEEESARQGLSEVVSFVGSRLYEQLPDWYRAADLTVLPSRSEGLPNVLRESLACGTPFVASQVGSIAEIADERHCRLVPAEDPSALAEALAGALAERASGLPTTFSARSWKDAAQSLLAILNPLIASAGNERKSSSPAAPPSVPRRRAWRQLLRWGLHTLLPRRWFLAGGPAASRSVCLTFDDGPHPEHTPRILDILKEHGVRATFFLIGRQAERHPDLVRRIVAEGHLVGNHTYSHTEPAQISAGQLREEVRLTRDLLTRITGQTTRLFRPPKGKVTAAKLWQLWRDGQTVVLWNADPRDYRCSSSDEVRQWFRTHPLKGGDVVLLHDDRPYAAEVLPEVITTARTRGYRFGSLDEWAC